MSFYLMFEVDEDDFAGVVDELEQRLSPVELTQFLYETVDPYLRVRIHLRFSGEGDEVTGRWHPLSVATQSIRANKGFPPSNPINKRYGQLYSFLVGTRSIVNPTGYGAILSHPGPAPDWRTEIKLKTAQQGKPNPATKPRPVIGLNYNDLMFIESELVAHLIRDFV